MYINNLGHMTKMAAMPIYGKNPSKIIFSETNRLISRKLCVRHRWLKYSNVYINHDPVMTLTKFMARSTWVACASELGKLLKCHLKEKANRKLANGQNIEDSEKRKWPKGLSAPALELNTIIFKHVYWYMQLISGERLQDHWSSGYYSLNPSMYYCNGKGPYRYPAEKKRSPVLKDCLFINMIISSPEPSGSQGELIVYPCSVVRPSVRRPSIVHHFQRSSSLKPLGQSKPNFT